MKTMKTYLNPELIQIRTGQLLGDAHADKSSPSSNTRLTWSFGSHYKEYADYMATLFHDYCHKGVYSVTVQAKKEGVSYVNYRLKTATLPVFNMFSDMFYKVDSRTNKRVKVVPDQINDLMSPVTLAHFIMGDGGFNSNINLVRLYTYNFTQADCYRLAQSITNLGVKTEVQYDRKGKQGENQYILKIRQSELTRLRSMVIPYMEKSMLYRIGL